MSEPLVLALRRNQKWAPNGKMDYARSVRKWHITPSAQTTFFVREETLIRTLKPDADGLQPENEPLPSFAATAAPAAPAAEGAPTSEEKANPLQQVLALFRRRGHGKVHKHPKRGAVAKTESGEAEVPADDVQNDLEYVVPVMIGTPGVTLNLDFDTGSSDLWVWGPTITTNASSHTIYSPTKSSTAKASKGLTWNISYGDGSSASGDVYTDVVTLGAIAIPNQAVEIAEKLSSAFTSGDGSDGLLGLAFPTINTVQPTQQLTPVANMIKEKLVEQPIFTVKLDKEDSKGFYTFGALASAADVGASVSDVQYTDVISSNGFWEFYSPSLTIGTVTSKREANNTAIADTGTTLLLLSDTACSLIYRSIPGAKMDAQAGGWVLPTNSTPPNLSFGVGTSGLEFGIPGEDLKFADAGNGMSFGSVQSRGGNTQDILGDVFLKRVYAIFDQTPNAPKIGFVQRPFN
ncbi:acid protease [Calocera cornea HHB12733]|uniref:Acid protease n=1 Tax=Calocera cornea HHB12733 TaxID=1353952 RepID=A0A165GSW0_9BASI|nr:acid protease [Calocera cornea HHB12733]